jgi:uncharacterized DUF497 family protein
MTDRKLRAGVNKNEQIRELPFGCVVDFDWETALYTEDVRYPYPERRFVAMGYYHARLHMSFVLPLL